MFSAQGFAGRGGMGGRGGGYGAGGGGGTSTGGAAPAAAGAGGGNFAGSPKDGASKGKSQQPIRPMSAKQLISAQRVGDGVMVVDGKEATTVTVMGRVVEYEAPNATGAMTAKHHGYRVTDGTGIITVRQWLDADKSQELLPIGSYIRASGTVKVWQERPIVTGTVRLVSDNNELTFHMLDVILTHLRVTRGPVPLKAQQHAASSSAGGAPIGIAAANPGEKLYPNDVVVNILKNYAKTDAAGGMTIEDVAQQAARFNFSIVDVRSAMKSLISEGKIFSVDATRYAA